MKSEFFLLGYNSIVALGPSLIRRIHPRKRDLRRIRKKKQNGWFRDMLLPQKGHEAIGSTMDGTFAEWLP